MTRVLAALALALLSSALGSLVLLAPPAYACSCVHQTTGDQARAADQVFVGVVSPEPAPTADATGGAGGAGVHRMLVRVDRVFAGELADRVQVVTAASPAACGIGELPVGEPVLFFTESGLRVQQPHPDGEPLVVANRCGGTAPVTDRLLADVTVVLGEPSPPHLAVPKPDEIEQAPMPGDGTPMWPWLAGLLAAAAGAATYAARRAR